ncbi:MAG: hypothetical protein ACRDT6_13820 [Micromonosporaceae bacterium]
MSYLVVLTRVRQDEPRDERRHPESRICRCAFPDRDTALWTARRWTALPGVRDGIERVKVVAVG